MKNHSSTLEINGHYETTTAAWFATTKAEEDKLTTKGAADSILLSTSPYLLYEGKKDRNDEEIHEVFIDDERKEVLQATRTPNNNSYGQEVKENLKNTIGNNSLNSTTDTNGTNVQVKEKVYGQICSNCSKTRDDEIERREKSNRKKVYGKETTWEQGKSEKNVSSLKLIIKEHTYNNFNLSKLNAEYQSTAITTTELDYLKDLLGNEYVLTSTTAIPTTTDGDENFTTYSVNENFYENGSDSAVRIIQEFPWPVKKEAVVEGDIVLGGLMMVHEREDTITCGPVMPQGGIQALEAMLYTLDRLNEPPTALLPNITLGAHILDDCDKDTYGLEMAVDFIKGKRFNLFTCFCVCIFCLNYSIFQRREFGEFLKTINKKQKYGLHFAHLSRLFIYFDYNINKINKNDKNEDNGEFFFIIAVG